jgi:nicotinate-nucleotide adenylyltransferase
VADFVNEENVNIQRVGVFGASFNPPTLGHQDVINQAMPHFDEILLVPSLSHPFGKALAPIHHRLAMLNLFLQNCPQTGSIVKILNIEATLQASKQGTEPIYTFDVLTELQMLYQSYQKPFQIRFILGPDNSNLATWQKFYRYQEIEKNWPLFIAHENLAIHSTMVRAVCVKYAHASQLRKKELIKLVGKEIANYIEEHHLYRETMNDFGKEAFHG